MEPTHRRTAAEDEVVEFYGSNEGDTTWVTSALADIEKSDDE